MSASVPPATDHIIVGFSDLDQGMDLLEKLSGVRPVCGGSHPGMGTRNALLALGNHCYLEILAPDPTQPLLEWYKKLTSLAEPMLVGWALRHDDLGDLAKCLRDSGVVFIGPVPGSRTRPDGSILRWKTLRLVDDKQGILPFYIQWASDSPHPSSDAPGSCVLEDLSQTGTIISSPPPSSNLKKAFHSHETAQLHARIAGNLGDFEFRSIAVPSEYWAAF